jgi:hypothetical protein
MVAVTPRLLLDRNTERTFNVLPVSFRLRRFLATPLHEIIAS